ncbi:hypothetical protein [Salinispora tropica]|uniref:Uncharacterized protein n=1 Tax=Salinispora tropica (strain ATCC BAA-916 / DSM 44818 / JCM 13857 / NBRC 105044 / CNB-440) TaxID=369723 RepID=A4XC01_SALTO|nr:hypothetical protein [Salinispora tropica]ABP56458.1 hypothetical protein Strop_4028 [Salinispora tropica CNB-440]
MPLTGPVDGEPAPGLFPAPELLAPPAIRGGTNRAVGRGVAAARSDDAGRQLTFFGAEAAEPAVADVAGLLAGPADISVMGGTARLAVVVDDAWRVHVLVAELEARHLPTSWAAAGGGRHTVRTAYTRVLKPLVAAWLNGPAKHPPDAFHLDGRGLRLWLVAAGAVMDSDVLLRLGPAAHQRVASVGAALAAVGLPAVPESGPDGLAYRITGRRLLNRFAELVGDPPPTVPHTAWPYRR